LENLKKRDHCENPGIDRRIILKWILKKTGHVGVDWINFVQWLQTLVNMVRMLQVS
jgi:hypothetical protein